MITRLEYGTIFVLDQDVAYKFYVDTLGFTVKSDVSMPNGFRWLAVSPPKHPDIGIQLMKVEVSEACPLNEKTATLLAEILRDGQLGMGVFECDDCRKTFEELSAKGVKFTMEPTEEFYGVVAVFEDPFGNRFSLAERPTAAK